MTGKKGLSRILPTDFQENALLFWLLHTRIHSGQDSGKDRLSRCVTPCDVAVSLRRPRDRPVTGPWQGRDSRRTLFGRFGPLSGVQHAVHMLFVFVQQISKISKISCPIFIFVIFIFIYFAALINLFFSCLSDFGYFCHNPRRRFFFGFFPLPL